MSALRMAEVTVGVAFNTRNESEVLRIPKGGRDAVASDTRNAVEEALERVREAFHFPKPDAATIARRERHSGSGKGLLCYDCGHEYLPGETVYYGRVRGWGFCSHTYQKVSYCESCKPSLWNTEYGSCDTCQRTVYYPYRNIDRHHVFCSQLCSSRYWNKVQRHKRLESRQKECKGCEKAFTAPRSDTKFCSAACKQKAYRVRQGAAA